MQHETHTHDINMSALGRDKQSLNLEQETVAIEVPGLSLYYGEKQALFEVSMNIPKQRVTAFIGPSGCGKSTFLRLLLAQERPTRGSISIDGADPAKEPGLERGVVFQKYSVFPHMTVRQNILAGESFRNRWGFSRGAEKRMALFSLILK